MFTQERYDFLLVMIEQMMRRIADALRQGDADHSEFRSTLEQCDDALEDEYGPLLGGLEQVTVPTAANMLTPLRFKVYAALKGQRALLHATLADPDAAEAEVRRAVALLREAQDGGTTSVDERCAELLRVLEPLLRTDA